MPIGEGLPTLGLTTTRRVTKKPLLNAVVMAYILNNMETTQHPSYSGVQQVAQDLSGKPWPDASLKAPVRFNSASLAKEEDADEDELPL